MQNHKIIGLCLSVALVAAGCQSREITARVFDVERVIDGDTFRVEYDGEPTSVRIAGIDAPELRDPGGLESKAELERLIGGRKVRLEFPGKRKRDNFGRLLANIYIGDRDIGAETVRDGFAGPYRK